jgi:hypothetical protein
MKLNGKQFQHMRLTCAQKLSVCPALMTAEVQVPKLVRIHTLYMKYLIIGDACNIKLGVLVTTVSEHKNKNKPLYIP